MGKRAVHDVGFDVDLAIERLSSAALAAGAWPEDAPVPTCPIEIALPHVGMHGIPGGLSLCDLSPCRAGGLCFALYEVAAYKAEREGKKEIIAAAERTERFRAEISAKLTRYQRDLHSLAVFGNAVHEQLASYHAQDSMHPHGALCEAPAVMLAELERMHARLACFSGSLRDLLDSPELRQPTTEKRSKLLLRSVRKHLRWGGVMPAEIARLVPDKVGSNGPGRRVKEGIRGDDSRSIHPYERGAIQRADIEQAR